MAARKSLTTEAVSIAAEPVSAASTEWVPSGSLMLDLVLGGGYPQGHVINLVGDRSSGKTLLAIEALANFVATGGKPAHAKYVDAESVFDETYAAVLGLPSGIQTCKEGMETVQEFFTDISEFLESVEEGQPCIYILDSLDALSDADEMGRDYNEGTYGAAKAKLLSQFFRRNITLLSKKRCLLIIVSQIRDKIGVRFGETKTRSGGKALDFYASQIIWLAEVGKLKRTALGVERVVGIETRARTKKNKVGLAFREADLTILFNYGVDDDMSMLNWLQETKAEAHIKTLPGGTVPKCREAIAAARKARDYEQIERIRAELQQATASHWFAIEDRLAPPVRKYG